MVWMWTIRGTKTLMQSSLMPPTAGLRQNESMGRVGNEHEF